MQINETMKTAAIISRAEALQILKNDLRRAALAKRSMELKNAGAKEREAILAGIECEIEKDIRRRAWKFPSTRNL